MNLLSAVAAGTFLTLAGIEVVDRNISETRHASEDTISVHVPEPSTFVLAGLGLAGIAAIRRRAGGLSPPPCKPDAESQASGN